MLGVYSGSCSNVVYQFPGCLESQQAAYLCERLPGLVFQRDSTSKAPFCWSQTSNPPTSNLVSSVPFCCDWRWLGRPGCLCLPGARSVNGCTCRRRRTSIHRETCRFDQWVRREPRMGSFRKRDQSTRKKTPVEDTPFHGSPWALGFKHLQPPGPAHPKHPKTGRVIEHEFGGDAETTGSGRVRSLLLRSVRCNRLRNRFHHFAENAAVRGLRSVGKS